MKYHFIYISKDLDILAKIKKVNVSGQDVRKGVFSQIVKGNVNC